MTNIEFLHEYTEDGLRLQGVHWISSNKNLCVVCIHGMTGNIIDNYFAEVLGSELSARGHGFIYGHNRGHSHISDFKKKNGSWVRIGAAYEVFDECIYDIDLWVKKAIDLGYKEVVLMGHSIGANKVLYYMSKVDGLPIKAMILASPSDMAGETRVGKNNYDVLKKEAEENIKSGDPNKLLSKLLDDWFLVSSKTFINSFIDGTNADNLPFSKDKGKYEQLSKIKTPILIFYGSKEDSKDCDINYRLNMVKKRAINCSVCETHIISNANHAYGGCEKELSNLISSYIEKL